MSSKIDDRIVAMKFDNAAFQRGVASTIASLDKLKASLTFGKSRGLDDLAARAKKTDLSHLGVSIEGVNAKLLAMGTIGVTALSQITSAALTAGAQLVKSLTIGPIGDGFSDYNAKLTSVQTVMNATGRDLEEVNGFFNQLDEYADSTVFNLSDMTGALAKFVNAGVSLEDAIPAIQGIGNMTALAGQGANEASIAYYNLSQSLAQGFLSTTDFKSLQLANVATQEWKQQMIDAATAAGKLRANADGTYTVLSDGSNKAFTPAALFTTELSRQWATAEVLNKVLGDYGSMTTEIGKKAFSAAQDVKSLPMMFDTLKAAVGTGWTQTFEIVLGDLEESKELFTDLTNVIGSFIGAMSDSRNALLQSWKDAGGRTALINGLANAFKAIFAILKPIGQAFRDVFDPITGGQLASITKGFEAFTKSLIISEGTAESIRKTFRLLFSVLDIGISVLTNVAEWMIGTFVIVAQLLQPIVRLAVAVAGALADVVARFTGFGEIGDSLADFMEFLMATREAFVGPVINGLNTFVDRIVELVNASPDAIFESMSTALERMAPIFDRIAAIAGQVWDILRTGAVYAAGALYIATQAVVNFFRGINVNMDTVKGALQTVLDFFVRIKDFLVDGLSIGVDTGGDVGKSVAGFDGLARSAEVVSAAFERITSTLKAAFSWIGRVSAAVGSFLGGAIAGLGEFLGKIDLIDVAAGANMAVMTAIFFQFAGILRNLKRFMSGFREGLSDSVGALTGTLQTMQTNIKAEIIRKIAIAIGILAAALLVLSLIQIDALKKALGAITILFVELTAAMVIMTKALDKWDSGSSLQMTAMGVTMISLSLALLILAHALQVFGKMKPEEFTRGMLFISIALLALMAAATGLDKLQNQIVGASASLVIMSFALAAMAGAILLFSKIDTKTFFNGFLKMGAALLLLVGAALLLSGIRGAIFGASAGIALMAFSLGLLIPVITAFGIMPWDVVIKGLVVMAAALAILVLAGAGAAAVAPGLLALSLTILAIGAAIFLAGAGMALFAVGVTALIAAFALVNAAMPVFILQLGVTIRTALKVMRDLIPDFVAWAIAVIKGIADTIIGSIDQIIRVFVALITAGLKVIRGFIPEFVETGFAILIAILEGIDKNLPKIVDTVLSIVLRFMDEWARTIPRLARAGFDALVTLLDGLTDAVNGQGERIGRAAGSLVAALGREIVSAIPSLIGSVGAALGEMFTGALANAASAVGGVAGDIAGGLGSAGSAVGNFFGRQMVNEMQSAISAIDSAISENMDVNPIIAPVLDLTQVQREASTLTGLLDSARLSPSLSLRQAADISNTRQQALDAIAEVSAQPVTQEVKFEQNNYSPKALAPADIYRNTSSQLALAKEALKQS